MNLKYKPVFTTTSFHHIKYLLVRNQKQFNRAIGKTDLEFLPAGSGAQVDFIQVDGDPTTYAIVQIGDTSNYSDIAINGLIAHEAVHIWQRERKLMGENKPSKEFEAYAIQTIFINLLAMYKDSE